MRKIYSQFSIKRKQQGMTLVGLMLSLVITLVSALVSLNLYVYNVRAVESIRTATTHNLSIMTSLIFVQKKIQAAGFGIAGANENDVITLFTPAVDSTPASRAILWRFFDNGTVKCHGIREIGVTPNGQSYRQLEQVTSVSDCNTTTALVNLAFDGPSEILGRWKINSLLSSHLATHETLFNFQVSKATCSISRLTTSGEHSLAIVSVPNTAGLNGHAIPSNVINICLVNVHPS